MSSLTVCNCRQNTLDPAFFGQWVPDHRTSNRKSPTAVHAKLVAWNGDLMTAGRTQTLAENSVRYWCAVVGQKIMSGNDCRNRNFFSHSQKVACILHTNAISR